MTTIEKTLVSIMVILVASQIFSLVTIRQLQYQNNATEQQLTAYGLASFLGRSGQSLPVDATTGQVYFAQARLTLPPLPVSPERADYRYSYWGGGPYAGAELNLVSDRDLSNAVAPVLATTAPDTSSSVTAKIAACSEGVMIAFTQHSELGAEGSKVLANGKTVYFYTAPHHECDDSTLLNYAKQIESY